MIKDKIGKNEKLIIKHFSITGELKDIREIHVINNVKMNNKVLKEE